MRKCAFGTAAFIVLASPALAANSGQVDSGEAPVMQARKWTGCYVGGHVGGLKGRSEKWIVRTPSGDFFGKSLGGHDVGGWLGGAQAGCDYQLDRVVLGIQGDYAWADANGRHASTREVGVSYHSDVKGVASVTARVGFVWDRFLGYAKGGVAWERDKYAATTTMVGTAYTASDTRRGWTIGAGGEKAATKSLSVFVEYNYYDFGTKTVRLRPQISGLRPAFAGIDETAHVVRAGLNLRFGG